MNTPFGGILLLLLTVVAAFVATVGVIHALLREKRDTAAEQRLGGPDASLDRQAGPGESYTVRLVFDLAVDAATPSLSVREGYGIDHLIELVLAGDENSLLHAKTSFRL